MLYLQNIKFRYHKNWIVNGVSAKLQSGNFVGIIGPNGSGKTTLLKCVYGLLDLDHGKVKLNDKRIFGPSESLIPGDQRMRLVSQDSKVSEFMSVWDNLEARYQLRSKRYIKERNKYLLKFTGLEKQKNLKPHELSGGQKQRLALACALVEMPEVLLLDEPFSQIDIAGTFELLSKLDTLRKTEQLTILMTSHDPDFILSFSNDCWVMNKGKIIQKDTPLNIHFSPKNETVAGLTGVFSILEGDILRPSQLKISDKGLKVVVENSYLMRDHYLIQASNDQEKFYIKSKKAIEPGQTIQLKKK